MECRHTAGTPAVVLLVHILEVILVHILEVICDATFAHQTIQ